MKSVLILKRLCAQLEHELQQRKETKNKRSVKLYSGKRKARISDLKAFLTTSRIAKEGEQAWFVELSVDGEVLFLEGMKKVETETWQEVEQVLCSRMLRNIFTLGVMETKKIIEENIKQP